MVTFGLQMKIALLTLGTLGDVQPYAVLGQALQRRGHQVTLSTAKNFESLVRSYGINFTPVEADFQAFMETEEGKKMMKNPFRARKNLESWVYPMIDQAMTTFFSVAKAQAMGTLQRLAEYLTQSIGDNRVIITLIGILSAIIDNVPLVAGAMGMYSMDLHPVDSFIWEYLAYCAGTGGSILVIGSAAGVAAMGMEKINFIWYLKRISFLAFVGYMGGALFYLATH